MPTITERRPGTEVYRGQIRTGRHSIALTPRQAEDRTDRYDPKIDIDGIIPDLFPVIVPVILPPEGKDQINPIKNLLIPNRGVFLGEALRSAMDSAIPKITVMVWGQDRHTLPVQDALRLAKKADGRVNVVFAGDPTTNTPLDVYDNTDLIIETAKKYGCDRVDLGIGFLAENHAAIKKMEEAGLISVGPTSEQVKALGNKANALRIAADAGIDVLPWAAGETLQDWETAKAKAEEIGFPLLIKADESGSGRGIFTARNIDEFRTGWKDANEWFNHKGGWHVTRMLEDAWHVEVQILGDKYGHVVALGERNCSVQRNRQKQFEETATLAPSQIEYLDKAAIAIAKGYEGAGTVEFLMDRDGKFYFMEVNTRLQVEHPVTEGPTGVDTIGTRYRTSEGWALDSNAIKRRLGHVIEFRLYAKEGGFIENIGLNGDDMPPNARVDICYGNGSVVPNGVGDGGNVDSLAALIVVSGYNRQHAYRRLEEILQKAKKQYRGKAQLNIDEGLAVMKDPRFIAGTLTTQESEELHEKIQRDLLQQRMEAAWDPGREAA